MKKIIRALLLLSPVFAGIALRAAPEPPPPPKLEPVLAITGGRLEISVEIPDGYHIFAGKELFGFDLKSEGGTLGTWTMPRPEREAAGPVYRGAQSFSSPISPAAGATTLHLSGTFRYQPCLEIGQQICYMPMSVPVEWTGPLGIPTHSSAATTPSSAPGLSSAATSAASSLAPLLSAPGSSSAAPPITAAANSAAVSLPAQTATAPPGEQCPPSKAPSGPTAPANPFDNTLWKALLLGFIGGLLLNLTPCTWPLIPITLGVLGALGAGVRRGHAFLLANGFALGLVLVYALLGTLAAILGKPFGSLTQNPWIYLGMTVLFLLFGLLTLRGAGFQLPAGVGNRLEGLRSRAVDAKAGSSLWVSVIIAILIGALSGLIVSPCTGPVLAAALVHVAQHQSALYGFCLFAAIGSGMALPFVFIGAFSADLTRLPRSGHWMEAIKRMLSGFIFLAALYFLAQGLAILGMAPNLRWMLLSILASALALAIFPWRERRSVLRIPAGAIGIAMIILTLYFSRPPPLPVVGGPSWRTDYAQALVEAARDKKPVIIDFWATWCAACRELDDQTYSSPEFAKAVESGQFMLIKYDMTDMSSPGAEALARCHRIKGLPTVIFMDREGRVDTGLTLTGFEPPGEFLKRMKRVE